MNQSKKLSTLITSLIVAITLIGCQSTLEPKLERQSMHPGRIIGLKGYPLIKDNYGNCMLHQLEAHEEGLRMSGGTGGVALEGGDATPIAHPSIISTHLNNVLAPQPKEGFFVLNPWFKGNDVAILVVDDFGGYKPGGPFYTLGNELFSETYSEASAQTFDATVEGWQESGALTHGALVYAHTLALVANLPKTTLVAVSPAKDKVTFSKAGINIVVKAVDTQGFQTDLIADAIENAITTDMMDMGITDIAANLSFSIVPCSVLYDYRWARANLDIPSFNEYVRELTEVPENAPFANLEEELLEIVLSPVNETSDPLYTLTTSSYPYSGSDSDDVVFVASSGNYSLGYALAPAMWDNVLSAAASDVASSTNFKFKSKEVLSSYSNNGEVMLPATWTRVTDTVGLNGIPGLVAKDLVWAGTSAAAPALSVFYGLDLGKGTPECGLVDMLTPKMAHEMTIEEKGWQTTIPTLKAAVDQYCNSNVIAIP